jgi:hypothetical protein
MDSTEVNSLAPARIGSAEERACKVGNIRALRRACPPLGEVPR